MKNFFKFTALFCSLTILLSSCGVMFGGSRYQGSVIAKKHSDADIYVNGAKIGRGSATFVYPRNQQVTIELQKEGCEDHAQTFPYSFRTGNFILTAFMFGLFGIALDIGTGASYKPDHRLHPDIEKLSTDHFVYTIDYPDCPETDMALNQK